MATEFAPEDLRRLNTWMGSIAQHLRAEAPTAFTPGGLRLGRKGGLSINADGRWYDHEANAGGPDALSLTWHLRNCEPGVAVLWARTWLAEHSGNGELSADAAAEAAAEAGERRAAYARRILDEARRAIRTRGHFPTDESALKLLFLVLNLAAKEWKMPPREWSMAKAQLAILFEDRFILA